MVTKKDMFIATLSNYGFLILKVALSLILVRFMFLELGADDYGFWALLWSIFGYSVLLEFGLGVTIQKKSAEILKQKDYSKFSALISTYIVAYLIISLVLIFVTIILSYNLESLFKFSKGSVVLDYQWALLIFGVGTALSFSLGFLSEVMKGLHKINNRNLIDGFFVLLNFVALYFCVKTHQPIYIFALVAVLVSSLNNITYLLYISKLIPKLHLSMSVVDLAEVKKSMKFSLSAYIIMLSNLIIFRTDQIILSSILGIAFAGYYQIASRMSELFRQLATPFHESLSTKAVLVTDPIESGKLLQNSNKIVGIIATILFFPLFFLIDDFLFLWLDITNKETLLSAKILIVSMFVLIVFRSSMVYVLLMNNKHTELMRVAVAEALLNIILSIILVNQFGIVGAAMGTLIPNVFFALFYNIPKTLTYTNQSFSHYLFDFIIPLMIATCFGLLLASAVNFLCISSFGCGVIVSILISSFFGGGVFLYFSHLLLIKFNIAN